MVKIVSVKFKNRGKSYYFAPGKDKYEKGMGVVVETAKGLEYATVVLPEGEVDESEIVPPLKPIVRIATKRDEEQVKRNEERRGEAMKIAQEKIAARGLEMKLVDCEFAFDGSKVAFFFTSENRVDFRELIKDLSSAFHMRIELRQINIRDEIKITGGLAPCGRECCCIGSIREPKKVSVKMAKNQGLSLNPGKISGLCGRLMCCLSYENDYYAEVCKKMPKVGSEADTPDGKGIVVNVNMLKMLIKVRIEQNDSVSYHEYSADQLDFTHGGVVIGRSEEEEDEDDGDSILRDLQTEEATHGQSVKAEHRDGRGRENGKDRPQGNGAHAGGERSGGKTGKGDPRREGSEKGEGEKREGEHMGGKKRNRNRNRKNNHANVDNGNQQNQNNQNNQHNQSGRQNQSGRHNPNNRHNESNPANRPKQPRLDGGNQPQRPHDNGGGKGNGNSGHREDRRNAGENQGN